MAPGKASLPFCHSERSEESLLLFLNSNRREIPRFARNDNKINFPAPVKPSPIKRQNHAVFRLRLRPLSHDRRRVQQAARTPPIKKSSQSIGCTNRSRNFHREHDRVTHFPERHNLKNQPAQRNGESCEGGE